MTFFKKKNKTKKNKSTVKETLRVHVDISRRIDKCVLKIKLAEEKQKPDNPCL